MHTHTHAHTRPHTHMYRDTDTNTCMHKYTCKYTLTHTCTHAHTHACTHTHLLIGKHKEKILQFLIDGSHLGCLDGREICERKREDIGKDGVRKRRKKKDTYLCEIDSRKEQVTEKHYFKDSSPFEVA